MLQLDANLKMYRFQLGPEIVNVKVEVLILHLFWSVLPLCQEGFIRVFPDANVTELDFIHASINQVSLSSSLDYSIAKH